MTTKQILQTIKLNPNKTILSITIEDAIERLLEFIKEWELSIKIGDISKEDWETLLDSYSDAIITYHPENYHQERATLLRNSKMLKKYGLTEEDYESLDFC